ncbi:MAG: hypothetical protein Q4B26_14790 [Eubacteriales bacterium]|nr:hypothetical protein [Eubacteriales bacterium]
MKTEAVEICPHCMGENVFQDYDPEKSGYVVKCQECRQEIFLCDECLHADDNEGQKCDWRETEDGGKCFRGIARRT